MTAQIIPVDTFDLVVFGGTGDLARRKLPHLSWLPCWTAPRSSRQKSYLALSNLVSVGGSWVAPGDAPQVGDWKRITELAKAAAALRAR